MMSLKLRRLKSNSSFPLISEFFFLFHIGQILYRIFFATERKGQMVSDLVGGLKHPSVTGGC